MAVLEASQTQICPEKNKPSGYITQREPYIKTLSLQDIKKKKGSELAAILTQKVIFVRGYDPEAANTPEDEFGARTAIKYKFPLISPLQFQGVGLI